MHFSNRLLTTRLWVRPLVYVLLASLIAAGGYGYRVLAAHEASVRSNLNATVSNLAKQREAYASYKQLQTTRENLAIIGGDTTQLDATLATVKQHLLTESFETALATAKEGELSAGALLDSLKTDQAKAEEEALKKGVLQLTVTNGASAEVAITQGETSIATGTTDANASFTTPLPVGTYTVLVSKYGFTSITTADVVITGKQTTTLNLSLATAPTPTPRASSTPRPTSTPTATPTPASSSTAHSSYRRTTVSSSRGSFTADIMQFELGAGKIKVATDTASDSDCAADCSTMAVKSYVQRHSGAVAGINGTYFCAADYSTCGAEKGHFFWKVYNTRLGRMINGSSGLGESDPFLIFDSVGNPTFLSYWNDYASHSFVAGINHKPAVVRNGAYSVDENALDDKQRTSKVARGAIGINGSTLYVVVVQSATVMDLGAVMLAVGATNALNLDGGGSSAMYYNGEYKRGPGRGVPNAIVFIEQ